MLPYNEEHVGLVAQLAETVRRQGGTVALFSRTAISQPEQEMAWRGSNSPTVPASMTSLRNAHTAFSPRSTRIRCVENLPSPSWRRSRTTWIVMIAGGVGVTPMMSKLRHLTESAWENSITLIYCVQTLGDAIFMDEMLRLRKRHRNFRLRDLSTVTDDPQGTAPFGYLTPDLIRLFAPGITQSRVHLCGPTPMMDAVLPMLRDLGVPQDVTFTETFSSLPMDQGPGSDEEVTITFQRSWRTVIARRGEGMIRVAEANGIAVDYSCRTGECGSCRCRLLAGEVDMPEGTVLSAKERKSGLILACVARPTSESIILDL